MTDTKLEYDRCDRELLERCCAAINIKTIAINKFKATKLVTRLAIEDLKTSKALKDDWMNE